MDKLLTVVVPVYQVEDYIAKCLDSLIIDSVLMERMDVLIVNDGTRDRSAEISREYVTRFPGVFRQVDKENGGHGSACNLGVQLAYGKYVKFLDSDDWLENLEAVVTKLEGTDADLVISSTICHCPGDKRWKLVVKDMEFDRVYDADRFDWVDNRTHPNYVLHHCAIYKTEMLRGFQPLFLENQFYDDMILGVAPVIGAKTLIAWDLEVYHYRMDREGQSISKDVHKRNVAAQIKVHQGIVEFLEKHPVSDETSTKAAFVQAKLPRCYDFGYFTLMDMFPYREAKRLSGEWDQWARGRNSRVHTVWMQLYRKLPFGVYWLTSLPVRKAAALYRKIR